MHIISLLLALQAAPTTAPPPRLAVIVGRANNPLTQPSFERWVDTSANRFASRFSVTALPLPDTDQQSPNPTECNALNVVGFLAPSRIWHMSSTTVYMTTRLVIYTCAGDRFFDGSSTLTEPRDQDMIPQKQAEAAATRGTEALLVKFAQFVQGHQVLWSRFRESGSLRELTPAPASSTPRA